MSMMYSRLEPPLVIFSRVDVGSPFATDIPPLVSVFRPSGTVQPLLGAGAPLLEPPPVPALPPLAAPPLPGCPPAAAPPEPPALEVPPLALPPLAVPPLALPPVAAPPFAFPPLALPALPEPPVAEPPAPLALPPVPTAKPPVPAELGIPGVELPQPPMIPIDNPKTNVVSDLSMRSFRGRAGTFLR